MVDQISPRNIKNCLLLHCSLPPWLPLSWWFPTFHFLLPFLCQQCTLSFPFCPSLLPYLTFCPSFMVIQLFPILPTQFPFDAFLQNALGSVQFGASGFLGAAFIRFALEPRPLGAGLNLILMHHH